MSKAALVLHGLEDFAILELDKKGANPKKLGPGVIEFEGNHELRIPFRIVELIGIIEFDDIDDIKQKSLSLSFDIIDPKKTFAARVKKVNTEIPTRDIELELGHAIYDITKASANLKEPEQLIFGYCIGNSMVIGLDLKGDISKRDYRLYHGCDAVSPCAAAALISVIKENKIFDPFCGSGTLSIEAALQEKSVFSLDPTPAVMELAKKNAMVAGVELSFFKPEHPFSIVSVITRRKITRNPKKFHSRVFGTGTKNVGLISPNPVMVPEGWNCKDYKYWQGKEVWHLTIYSKA